MNGKHFRRRPLAIALAATLAFSSANALAADVEIRTPAGGGFAVRDSTGSLLRLFLDGSTGALSIPFLTTAAVQPNPICFQNGTGLHFCNFRVTNAKAYTAVTKHWIVFM